MSTQLRLDEFDEWVIPCGDDEYIIRMGHLDSDAFEVEGFVNGELNTAKFESLEQLNLDFLAPFKLFIDQAEIDDHDPTPWCHVCGAMRQSRCKCGPIAKND